MLVQFEIIINVLVSSSRFIVLPMHGVGYGYDKYSNYSSAGSTLTSESDVCSRQILTSKVDPRAKMVNTSN